MWAAAIINGVVGSVCTLLLYDLNPINHGVIGNRSKCDGYISISVRRFSELFYDCDILSSCILKDIVIVKNLRTINACVKYTAAGAVPVQLVEVETDGIVMACT